MTKRARYLVKLLMKGFAEYRWNVLLQKIKLSQLVLMREKWLLNDFAEIDISGCTVLPELIDSHCHISFDQPSTNDELFSTGAMV